MSDHVYYGVWTNWSRGKVDGSTMTLSSRGAGVLIAFLAIFVSVAGGSLWRILAFAFHQKRVSKAPRDGLHYQQQAILRNAATPGVASWQLLWLIPPWRKLSRRPIWNSLPIVVTALVSLCGFFAAGILVSEVTRTAGNEVLIRSPDCGNWTLDTEELILAFESKTLNDTTSAATYARACYGGPSDALECNQYQVQNLPYTRSTNASCPFADGMCLNKFPVLTLDTGNISSHEHLGINTKSDERLQYRRKTTCAPLKDAGYITTFNYSDIAHSDLANTTLGSLWNVRGQDGDVIDFYNFGPVKYNNHPTTNYTYWFNRHAAFVGDGYQLAHSDYSSGDGDGNLWHPDEALLRDDADVSIMFLSANDILYFDRVEDPIFQATTFIQTVLDNGRNVSQYTSDYFVNPLGCIDQHQFCNPRNDMCTKLDSYSTAVRAAQSDLQLNAMQYVTVSTLSLDLLFSTISQSIGGRGSAALRAQELVFALDSAPLPKDQWMKEVEYWFSTGLAKIQRYFVDYATGPTNVLNGSHIAKPNDSASRQLCNSQKIKAPPGANVTSFSTLGVAIILAVGGLLILAHVLLDYLVSNVMPSRNYKLARWALDEKLQLQKLAYERAGLGNWKPGPAAVPTTTQKEQFGMEIDGWVEGASVVVIADEEKDAGAIMVEQLDSRMGSPSPKPSTSSRPSNVSQGIDSFQLPPIAVGDEVHGGWLTATPERGT